MDDVERMYRHLVVTIRTSFPQYLSQPFEVGELHQTILPYRLHRKALGLETNQDYELALLELLTGAHGYLVIDDRMRDELSAELASATPDTSRLRAFSAAHVALAPEALQQLDATPSSGSAANRESASMSRVVVPVRAPAPATPSSASTGVGAATGEVTRREARPITVAAGGENCVYCNGDLPAGRQISFCPHCGQDLTVFHCPACGSELERGWKFCAACGRGAGER
jgi:hypothetical protein